MCMSHCAGGVMQHRAHLTHTMKFLEIGKLRAFTKNEIGKLRGRTSLLAARVSEAVHQLPSQIHSTPAPSVST